MKLAMYTPVPPARTGVVHYVSMLLPALRKRAEVEVNGGDGARIYQLGNNPHHEFVYREAMQTPGVAVLHDVVLHHLIVEMTLARGDAEGYVAALRASHGEAGAAWARGRAAGLHSEMGNFLMPASVEVANRSKAVIVHNAWAADRLRSLGVTTPVHVVPHPYFQDPTSYDRDPVRRRLGFSSMNRVIGLFGFLTSAKRAEVVIEAFRRARRANPGLRLLIVGEPAPNIDVKELADDGVVITGYVSDQDFGSYYAAADRFVNLRYPSAGETSGTLIRAFDAGKPVAVSDYAQFAEYPADIVVKIPFGEGEVEALTEFLLRDIDSPASAQRDWLDKNARIEQTVEGYLSAAAAAPGRRTAPAQSGGVATALQIFANVTIRRAQVHGSELTLTLKNNGASTLQTHVYGQPGYRAVIKLMSNNREVQDRWIELPRDVHPGESVDITISLYADADSVRLFNALESIPIVDQEPASVAEIVRV